MLPASCVPGFWVRARAHFRADGNRVMSLRTYLTSLLFEQGNWQLGGTHILGDANVFKNKKVFT